MKNKSSKIHIIGAGVSGLIAAQILENYGYKPTILEGSNSIGGRVKSDLERIYLGSRFSSFTNFLSSS